MAALKKRDVRPQTSSRRVSTASAASDADSPVLLLKILPYLDLAVQLRKIHLKLELESSLLWMLHTLSILTGLGRLGYCSSIH